MLAGAHAARWAGMVELLGLLQGCCCWWWWWRVMVMRKSWELELVCTGWLERGRAQASAKDRAGAGQPPGRHRLDKKYTRLNIWKLPRTAHHRPTLPPLSHRDTDYVGLSPLSQSQDTGAGGTGKKQFCSLHFWYNTIIKSHIFIKEKTVHMSLPPISSIPDYCWSIINGTM